MMIVAFQLSPFQLSPYILESLTRCQSVRVPIEIRFLDLSSSKASKLQPTAAPFPGVCGFPLPRLLLTISGSQSILRPGTNGKKRHYFQFCLSLHSFNQSPTLHRFVALSQHLRPSNSPSDTRQLTLLTLHKSLKIKRSLL